MKINHLEHEKLMAGFAMAALGNLCPNCLEHTLTKEDVRRVAEQSYYIAVAMYERHLRASAEVIYGEEL